MNKLYYFILIVLLLCLAFTADLLAYLAVEGSFFVIGLFVLGTLLALSIFFYGNNVGSLFSMALFGITLLSGVILFHPLFADNKEVIALLLIVGSFGFVGSLCFPCKKNSGNYGNSGSSCAGKKTNKMDMPPLPLIYDSPTNYDSLTGKGKNEMRVSTYEVEHPEISSLATMESLDSIKDSNDDFVELKDIENLIAKKPTKKNGKKKKK